MPDRFAQVDLSPLTYSLQLCFRSAPPRGYEDGKHQICSMLMRLYECETDSARRLVDHLEREGFIRHGSARARGRRKGRRSRKSRSDRSSRDRGTHPELWRFDATATT